MIISCDNLRVRDDAVLAAAVVWAEAECVRKGLEPSDENKRFVLGDMIYHIRFTLLDPKVFVHTMSLSALLLPEEKVSILSHFIDDSVPVPQFCNRSRKMPEFWRPVRFVAVEHSQWLCNSGTDAISFSCNMDILMHGFLIYRARRTESQQMITISSQLYNDENKVNISCTFRLWHDQILKSFIMYKFHVLVKLWNLKFKYAKLNLTVNYIFLIYRNISISP